jgi:hypothetical protein
MKELKRKIREYVFICKSEISSVKRYSQNFKRKWKLIGIPCEKKIEG